MESENQSPSSYHSSCVRIRAAVNETYSSLLLLLNRSDDDSVTTIACTHSHSAVDGCVRPPKTNAHYSVSHEERDRNLVFMEAVNALHQEPRVVTSAPTHRHVAGLIVSLNTPSQYILN